MTKYNWGVNVPGTWYRYLALQFLAHDLFGANQKKLFCFPAISLEFARKQRIWRIFCSSANATRTECDTELGRIIELCTRIHKFCENTQSKIHRNASKRHHELIII